MSGRQALCCVMPGRQLLCTTDLPESSRLDECAHGGGVVATPMDVWTGKDDADLYPEDGSAVRG